LSGDVYRNVLVTKGTVTDPHLPAARLDEAHALRPRAKSGVRSAFAEATADNRRVACQP
jgi:hypothetical protein